MADELVQLEPRAVPEGPTLDGVVEALQRAYAFVEAEGCDLDKLRFLVLLGHEAPDALLTHLASLQEEGGLFRVAAERGEDLTRLGPIAQTLRTLCVLDDHDLLHGPDVEGCVAALSTLQREDGRWEEGGDEDHSLFLTGMCGAYLVKSDRARLPAIDGAVEALARYWSQERVSAQAWPLLASYYHLLSCVSHDLGDEAMAWCGRELDKGVQGGVLTALDAARIFLFCGASALPGCSIDGGALLPALLAAQREDGGFSPAPAHLGLATPGEATLSAVIALSHFGRSLPGDELA